MGTTINASVFDRLKAKESARLCVNGLSVDAEVNLWSCLLESNEVKIDVEYCVCSPGS